MGICNSNKPHKGSFKRTNTDTFDNLNKPNNPSNQILKSSIAHNRKFERQITQRHTVNEPKKPHFNLIEPPTSSNPRASLNEVNQTFKRKNSRSISLIEKNNLGTALFKQEMNLKVTPESLVEETKGLPTAKYKVISKLGDGSFGTVYLAINQLTKGQVAMKRIAKTDLTLTNDTNVFSFTSPRLHNKEISKENEENSIKNEIEILKKLDHPNIVKITEFYTTKNAYYIINDYCMHGELYSKIKLRFNEIQLAVLFYQILSGLCYLHANNICHRDLKLENILINDIEKDIEKNYDYLWIKIIDFGTATIFERNRKEKAIVGSSYYIAPEVLKKKYNEKCDTWSAGVILHMLIVGKAPFDGNDDEQIINRIRKGLFNTQNETFLSASIEVRDLITKLLEVKVDKRLSAKEALQHQWFKKYDAKRLYSNIPKETTKKIIQKLLTYKISSKIQQLVIAFIVHNLPSNETTKNALKLFRMFNESDDGKLTKRQLQDGLIQYIDETAVKMRIDDLFMLLDGGNNGYLQYEDFLRGCLDKKAVMTDDLLMYAFSFIDKDNTNRITVKKIKECFVVNTDENKDSMDELFKSMFKEVHHDEKGAIDFVEFKQIMLDI